MNHFEQPNVLGNAVDPENNSKVSHGGRILMLVTHFLLQDNYSLSELYSGDTIINFRGTHIFTIRNVLPKLLINLISANF